MTKRDRTILNKIVSESAVIAGMLDGIDETAFSGNDEKMRAVCMALINIGELVKNLTDEFRAGHKQIPWKSMAGFRDVAAHGYFTLRMPDVWLYAKDELPALAEQLKVLLNNEEETR